MHSTNYLLLKQFHKKSITKEELQHLLGIDSIEELYSAIQDLQQNNLLQPIKNSQTNGNLQYPIFLKYRITLPADSFDLELEDIHKLHPLLQNNGYLQKKPAEYRKYKSQLQALDLYLFKRSSQPVPISRKERSFEIFGEEKYLDDSAFWKLLQNLGLSNENLYFYDTPEYCFHDYIPERKPQLTLLICENKDIWFNIRRRMFENRATELLGVPIDGVVYGCGNKVSKEGALTAYTNFMGNSKISYLYWGDIDRAGLDIFLSLKAANPQLNIQLFIPAYEKMLELSRSVPIPDSDDHRNIPGNYSSIYGHFSESCQELLKRSIEENKRIPQEIISYALLLKEMR